MWKPSSRLVLDLAGLENAPLLEGASTKDVFGPHPDYFDSSFPGFVRVEDGIIVHQFSALVTSPFLYRVVFPGFVSMFFCRSLSSSEDHLGKPSKLSRGFVSISVSSETTTSIKASPNICSAVYVYVRHEFLIERFGLDYAALPEDLAGAIRREGGPLFNFVLSLPAHSAISLDAIFETGMRGKTRLMFIKAKVIELVCDVVDRLNVSWRSGLRRSLTAFELQQVNIEVAASLLRTNLRNPPNVESLARRFGLSRSRFVELFSQRFGVTPNAYSMRHRFEWAHNQLRHSPLKMSDISNAIGYKNPSAFTRAYSAFFGIAPSRNRAALDILDMRD